MKKKTTPKTLVPSAPPPSAVLLPHPSALGTVDIEAYFIEKCLVLCLYYIQNYRTLVQARLYRAVSQPENA